MLDALTAERAGELASRKIKFRIAILFCLLKKISLAFNCMLILIIYTAVFFR
jgi:hypothetical protein